MSDKITYLSDQDFAETIKKATTPVLVDFYADWCGPCQMLGPVLEELADEFAGQIQISKINIDQNKIVTSEYGVMRIPTMIILHNQGGEIKLLSKQDGFSGKEGVASWIKQTLAAL
ncbi:MAG TPA: thioredoxin [Candidatus Woesebacteria bacterium]|nr:thioredoxin [Candidatus Woesebacteria bacterium]